MAVKAMTEKRMREIIQGVCDREANMYDIERAFGMLVAGKYFGWQYLRLAHSYYTFRKAERILAIDFREELPARTAISDQIVAIRLVDQFGKFWQALASNVVGKDDFVLDCG